MSDNWKERILHRQQADAERLENAENKLLGVTAMTTLLGRKQFNDILGSLVTRSQGKPALVPETDKRPEMKSSAQNDFFE